MNINTFISPDTVEIALKKQGYTVSDSVEGINPKHFISNDSLSTMIKKYAKLEPVGPANNEIWYTSSNGQIIDIMECIEDLIEMGGGSYVGPEILSNTYTEGKGVITFASDITILGSIQDEKNERCYPAFYQCSVLTSVTIPSSVTSIEYYAFYQCSVLTSVTIPSSVTSIGSSAFYECSSLTSVTIPEGVTSIGSSAFSGCSSLTSVTIPEGVTTIGSSAFSGCSSLTSVTIPEGVTTIGYETFSGCSSLTSVTIPEGVTSIDSSAFYECSSLTSVTIPSSVTYIGDHAFNYSITSDTITYLGTVSEWESVDKYSTGDPRRTIIVSCTDGETEWEISHD